MQQMIEFVRYATMAPSGHNTQPWKFLLTEDSIRIFPDFTRSLPVVDPDNRELYISLGCALENLVIASKYVGYDPEVEYFPADEPDECLLVTLKHSNVTGDNNLFQAIPKWHTNRREYKNDKTSWIDVGRSFERIALILTSLNIESAHLNQPCEVPQLKRQLQQHLALGSAYPQLLLRIGYAEPLPRSPRRSHQHVLI